MSEQGVRGVPCSICGQVHDKVYSPDVGPNTGASICFGCLCKMVLTSIAVAGVRQEASLRFMVGGDLPDS